MYKKKLYFLTLENSPPKGANLPYRPKPLLSPLYIPGNQGFTVPASVASLPGQEQLSKGFPAPPVPMAHAIPMLPSAQNIVPGSLVPINGLGPAALPALGPPLGTALGPALWPSPLPPPPPHQQQPQPPQPPHCLTSLDISVISVLRYSASLDITVISVLCYSASLDISVISVLRYSAS
ncbi:hypothetical protein ElyMa_004035200 [Elysia marginata]|uniref:Uncharacterized protein n=1 Tax=Elysia marginata TaxID=1093978 RepID=A0AAV4G383_9GAST|nr:hypothetical protein ElyMa_004035200 [Elysia marginata]